jgi:hypothetical protein
VQIVMERADVDRIVERLVARDERVGEDARAAVEWLTGWEEENPSAVFTRRRLLLFLGYELPAKWMVSCAGHLEVVAALALFFDEVGPQASGLARICRDDETERILRDGGEGFAEAIDASGLEPPDTPLLEWSDFMTVEESIERGAIGDFLELEVDGGRLIPGEAGWRRVQIELVERRLMTADAEGTSPLARIHAARRDAWLAGTSSGGERSLLEAATPIGAGPATVAEAEDAIEPLLWLLGRLASGTQLTQTGAFPRALVREACERYPDWWDSELHGLPNREMDVRPLELLHWLIDGLKLARKRRGVLTLTPLGRELRTDPATLLAEIALGIALVGSSHELDLELAQLVAGDEPAVTLATRHLLQPFGGVAGGWPGTHTLTSGGRILAATVLRARAFGPGHVLD